MLQKRVIHTTGIYDMLQKRVTHTTGIYDMLQKRVIHTTGIYDMYRVIDFYNFQCRFLKLCRVITHLLEIYNLAF